MNENTEKKTIDYKAIAKKAFYVGAGIGSVLVCYMGLRSGYKLGRTDGMDYVLRTLLDYNADEGAKFIQYCVDNNK